MPVFNPDDIKRLPSPKKNQTSRPQAQSSVKRLPSPKKNQTSRPQAQPSSKGFNKSRPQHTAAQANSKPSGANTASARSGRFMDGWNTGPNHTAADETRARARADGAKWQAEQERARQARANAGTTPQPKPAPSTAGVAAKGRSVLNKGLGGRLGAAAILSSAVQPSFEEDSTRRYAQRFGVNEPTGDGSLGDIAKFAGLRAGGFATDLANTMTFGQAGRLYRDNNQGGGDPASAEAMGNVVGGAAGWHGAPFVGKTLDKAGTVASRGKYKGNLAEKALSNKFAKGASALTGLNLGGAAGRDLNNMADGEVEASQNPEAQPEAQATTTNNPAIPAVPATAAAATGSREAAKGIPTFTNQDANQIDPSRINTMPSEAVMSTSPAASAQVSKALQAAAARGDWDAVQRHYDSKGQNFNGRGFRKPEDQVTVLRDTDKMPSNTELMNARMESAQKAADLQQRALEQQGALGFGKLNLERDLAQNKLASNERIEKLYQQYEAARTPEQRRKIATQIQQLSGSKGGSEKLKDNYMLVGGGQEWDQDAGLMRNVPQTLIDLRTGQPVNSDQQQEQQEVEFEDGKYYQDKNGNIVYFKDGKAIPYS